MRTFPIAAAIFALSLFASVSSLKAQPQQQQFAPRTSAPVTGAGGRRGGQHRAAALPPRITASP